MKNPLSILLLLLVVLSCNTKVNHNHSEKLTDSITDLKNTKASSNAPNESFDQADTTITYQNEEYRLSIKISDPDKAFEETNNGLFTITRLKDNNTLISDSIKCMIPQFKIEDYNRDSINDILVYNIHGARANTHYYLYLTDTQNKSFRKVKGFEELPNAEIDSNKIITSTALYGRI